MRSRADRTLIGEWWWTIDRGLLFAIVTLMVFGVILSLAASPPVAERLDYDLFHFVNRQAFFMVLAVPVMLVISFFSPRYVRRLALLIFVSSLAMMLATLFFGAEIKGARRWLSVAGITVQPSEFMKPAFVVLMAWLFAESLKRPDMPARAMAIGLAAPVVLLLILQPDFGQTVLVVATWGALFFLAGMPWVLVALLGGLAMVGVFAAYTFIPHVAGRIDRFLNPDSGDSFQIDQATQSFTSGGFLGKGPGEGTVKRILPDAHTDFIFAVTAEEFGIMFCLILMAVFAFVVFRGLFFALRNEDPFARLAAAGLVTLFGLQSFVNMAVNVSLLPAKGMTLPFISYGGSSLVSLAIGMGMLLAIARRRPRSETVMPRGGARTRSIAA